MLPFGKTAVEKLTKNFVDIQWMRFLGLVQQKLIAYVTAKTYESVRL